MIRFDHISTKKTRPVAAPRVTRAEMSRVQTSVRSSEPNQR